ncbi:hypothetical protein [Pseudoxanthomonas sp. GM95]|uniref:hypothetical protein n=1 Tax=Pseudoxanthomonas sp. GM95 TaxID=1881043 RepID=UPI0011146362|nr:hypothetical protein [Pseudoxanthomonas sp. GM95]
MQPILHEADFLASLTPAQRRWYLQRQAQPTTAEPESTRAAPPAAPSPRAQVEGLLAEPSA